MPLIKRYPNRKLYDTAARAYVSLGQIAALIRRGEEVQVVDHATGEDVTALVLSQIIVEQARAGIGDLSRGALTALIRTGSSVLDALRHGMGTASEPASQVDVEIARRLARLVEAGELADDEAARLRDRLCTATDEMTAPAGWPAAAIHNAVARRDIAARAEVAALAEQLAALEAEVAALIAARRAPAADQNVTAS